MEDGVIFFQDVRVGKAWSCSQKIGQLGQSEGIAEEKEGCVTVNFLEHISFNSSSFGSKTCLAASGKIGAPRRVRRDLSTSLIRGADALN